MKCEVCGNDYDKAFAVEMAGQRHTFDSFECAIHALAPTCGHCGCHIVGHGVEQNGSIYCCVHCASQAGAHGLKDRNDTSGKAPPAGRKKTGVSKQKADALVREASEESFPASDPPAWSGGREA
ncbi:MAG TPA: hypothetical protein VFB80_13190 [Pirellulaceae bacterium]|nr:hypothetical protein [Pirellulaceae bacterium]